MEAHDTASAAALARRFLAELFFGALSAGPATMESFEDEALGHGHALMAEAMAAELERLDAELCATPLAGFRVHDRRRRTLTTKMGDVSFAWTRVRDRHGFTEVPLADALDVPHGCRVSPAASAFLVAAGAEVSYARAARLLTRAGGSSVSASAVMLAPRRGPVRREGRGAHALALRRRGPAWRPTARGSACRSPRPASRGGSR